VSLIEIATVTRSGASMNIIVAAWAIANNSQAIGPRRRSLTPRVPFDAD
jgi:hypothetical protein